MSTAAPLLAVRDVAKTFAGRAALSGVSFEVAAGEMIALIGPSGSGKSTLLRALSGLSLIDPGQGEIRAFGDTVQARGRLTERMRSARTRIGFIFQQFNLVGRLTLYTNVVLGALGRIPVWRGLLGIWPVETKDAAMAALARVEVVEQAGQRAATLSGGQQQRGAIARALVQRAAVILADEPVASLDPVQARRVMAILRELNRSDGLTVLVSLHHVDYALQYCDRVIALKGGRVEYDGPVASLDRARLVDIYGPEFSDVWESET